MLDIRIRLEHTTKPYDVGIHSAVHFLQVGLKPSIHVAGFGHCFPKSNRISLTSIHVTSSTRIPSGNLI